MRTSRHFEGKVAFGKKQTGNFIKDKIVQLDYCFSEWNKRVWEVSLQHVSEIKTLISLHTW